MSKIDQLTVERADAAVAQTRIPPAAFILTGAVMVIGSNSLVLAPIAPEVSSAIGVSVQRVMAASAAFGLGTAASALFLARFIDRFGAWRLLRTAFVTLALALAASAVAPNALMLAAAQLVAGLAAGVALPAIYSSAATVAPAGRENETVGIVLTGWTLSMVAGVSLSAVLADILHWRAVYGCVAMLAAAGVVALSLNGRRDVPSDAAAIPPFAALAIPGVVPLLAACGAFMAAFYGTYAYIGDHATNALGRPVSYNGILAVLYGLGFGGAALLDRLMQRHDPRRLLPLAFLAVACIYVLMAALSASFATIAGCVVFWGMANHFGLNLLIVRLTAIDPSRRGAIMGLNSAVTYFAAFAGTLAFGPVYAHSEFVAAAALAAVLMVCAVLAVRR
ncbi:MAG: MFS transporter [Rhizobiaceae bacterium]|nr:MFS transporter [Rhizobiaceae bacterium]